MVYGFPPPFLWTRECRLMFSKLSFIGCFATLFGAVCLMSAAPPDTGSKKPQSTTSTKPAKVMPFSEAEKIVAKFFDEKRDFEPNDLITKDDVAPLLEKLKKKGFPLIDGPKILELVPDSDEYLAQQFSTPQGCQFMRQIAKFKNGYDRVDRLSRLPRGKPTVESLIAGPDGYKMIEYMSTAAGGKELGKMLSQSPGGTNFNEPTGRIYTVSMLVDRLRESYDAATKPKKKKDQRK